MEKSTDQLKAEMQKLRAEFRTTLGELDLSVEEAALMGYCAGKGLPTEVAQMFLELIREADNETGL